MDHNLSVVFVDCPETTLAVRLYHYDKERVNMSPEPEYEQNKLGGWLSFFFITRWISMISMIISTIVVVVEFSGYGIEGTVFGMLVCGLLCCVGYVAQILLLKGNHMLHDKDEYRNAYICINIGIAICSCILLNTLVGTWVASLIPFIAETVIWGAYFSKSKRAARYF